jgi:hypothetical protein
VYKNVSMEGLFVGTVTTVENCQGSRSNLSGLYTNKMKGLRTSYLKYPGYMGLVQLLV